MPLIVLSSHSWGWLQSIIKMRTKANYNHIMWMIEPNTLASQDLFFTKVPLENYMRKGFRLKFYSVEKKYREKLIKIINDDLSQHWIKRRYDFVGIVGQLIGIRILNIPYLYYCSEKVPSHIRKAEFIDVPKHRTPKELNEFFENNPNFKYYGHWISD